MTDPVAAADAVVAAVDPGLSSPGVERRDVVLVTGPWLAGTPPRGSVSLRLRLKAVAEAAFGEDVAGVLRVRF